MRWHHKIIINRKYESVIKNRYSIWLTTLPLSLIPSNDVRISAQHTAHISFSNFQVSAEGSKGREIRPLLTVIQGTQFLFKVRRGHCPGRNASAKEKHTDYFFFFLELCFIWRNFWGRKPRRQPLSSEGLLVRGKGGSRVKYLQQKPGP